MSYNDWHDEIMEERCSTILDCLADIRMFSIEKTEKGFRIVELLDEYNGTTLSVDQMCRLIAELQQLLGSATS
jgi:hypothetical protein